MKVKKRRKRIRQEYHIATKRNYYYCNYEINRHVKFLKLSFETIFFEILLFWHKE